MSREQRIFLFLLLLFVLNLGGIFFARRNLRLGRGDRRNATRLAVFVAGLMVFAWIFSNHHVLTWGEGIQFLFWAGISLLLGCWLWVLYIAVEPFVRRKWPQVLVSWTRLLTGDIRDPLVARDALAGCAGAIFLISIMEPLGTFAARWLGYPELAPSGTTDYSIIGSSFISYVFGRLWVCIIIALGYLCLLFLWRVLLRNDKAAFVAWVLTFPLLGVLTTPWIFTAMSLASLALELFLLMRFGLVALVLVFFVREVLWSSLITLDASAWYAPYGYAALAMLAVIVLYAFRISLGGQPLFGRASFEE